MMIPGIIRNGCVGRLLIIIITSVCWVGSCLLAQPAQLDFRHYTTNDGLPSSEIYTVFQDREGFIWIGTDNGVARFDGYEFIVFDADDGLEDMVVFTIMEGKAGKLWVSTYSGKIFYYEDGRFHPYAYNNITIELKRKSFIVKLADITDEEEVIVYANGSSIVKITAKGEIVQLCENQHKSADTYAYAPKQLKRGKSRGGVNILHRAKYPASRGKNHFTVLGRNEDETSVDVTFRPGDNHFIFWYLGTMVRDGQTELAVASYEELIITALEGNKTRRYTMQNGKTLNYVLPGWQEGEYLIFLNRGLGVEQLAFGAEGEEPEVTKLLNGHSVSSGFIDQDGGLWITTLDDGIYYSPYPNQKIYLKDDVTENAKSISLALTGPESFYAGYDDGSVFRYDEGGSALWNIQQSQMSKNERMFDLFYDRLNSRLYTSFFSFKHPIKKGTQLNEKQVAKYHPVGNTKDNFTHFNYMPDWYPDALFATRGYTFVKLPLDGSKSDFYSRSLGINFIGGHVLGADAGGRKFLGTLHGLFEITPGGRMVPENLGVAELSGRVVFIKSVNKKALLFGTRGNGLVYYDQDTSYLIKESHGLASNMIRDIHKSEQGIFWISTLNGLSKVTFSPDGHTYNVRTFRKENGLSSNEVTQADTWGDEIWLATSVGITHFKETPVDSTSLPPTIRKVLVNGKEVDRQTKYDLPSVRSGVSIHFGTTNYILGNKVKYRYRIAADADWQHTFGRTANYPDLGAGDYHFAVQSRNHDGFWSESTELDICVASPWYESWWAITGGVVLLISGLSAFFLFRERRRKHEQRLMLQINELEHAALHAQMNPHFVFNALNSIQNFVLQNDAKRAATYLSRFARIIRQTLRSSVEGRHTLREELEMLGTYLVLEKLRFKDGFNYELTVSPDLPLDDIELPPLLIQPFVENAIVHGLKYQQRGGWISIDFSGTSELLCVQIEDNGTGFDPLASTKNDSLGMDITRRRLRMMNRELKNQSGMIVEPLKDDSGSLCGTRVTLKIQLRKERIQLIG